MRSLQLKRFGSLICVITGLFGFCLVPRGFAQTDAPDSAVYGVPVYVSDFELHAAGARPNAGTDDSALPAKPPTNSPVVYNDADLPSAQARRLTDFFTASLLQALNKRGFPAARTDGQKAPAGALIRGVFTEPDARNRTRRALLGSASPGTRFFLYVGVFNLAREEQLLYQLAPTQTQNERYGPVITLNTYIPLAKFELDKNPSEEDVRKICEQIAASLVSLLADNTEAFSK